MSISKKKRRGFSLIELLIAVVVLGILAAMVVNSGLSAQKKARATAALTALKDYEAAFSTAVMTHPGIMTDREKAWGDGTGYTTKKAMERVLSYMNESLETDLQLGWNDAATRYESVGEDPWGGKYIITEFPLVAEDATGYNPTEAGSPAEAAMRLAIFATGVDGSIEEDKKVHDGSIGVGLEYRHGYVSSYFQGVSESYPFSAKGSPEGSDYIVKFN